MTFIDGGDRLEDQQKIQLAISLRRLDPTDVTGSKMSMPLPGLAAGSSVRPSQQKRKMEAEAEGEVTQELDSTTPEIRDELYCVLNTNVVGTQYYKGLCTSQLVL